MYLRKRKFIRRDLQIRFILLSLAVASAILLVNFQLSLQALLDSSIPMADNPGVRPVLEGLRISIIWRFLLCLGVAMPLAVAAGIYFSFPFAGPCYRFKKYFEELVTGRWDVRCTLRKKDELMDIADAINGAMDSVRSFLAENRKVVAEAEDLLARGGLRAASGSDEAVRSLRERIEATLAVYRKRFPAPADPVHPTPASVAGAGPATEATEKEPESSLQR
jgi:methyl-accepting chemotaxis protein